MRYSNHPHHNPLPQGRRYRADFVKYLYWIAAICISFSHTAYALELEGFTRPFREIDISSPETGVIKEYKVREGQSVKAGEIIAKLDNRILDASLAIADERRKATGAIDAARAEYKRKLSLSKRLSSLLKAGSARQEEVDKALAETQIANAQLMSARERKKIAELEHARILAQIEYRTFRSPIDGVVTQTYKDAGELVTPNDALVAQVSQLNQLRIDTHLLVSKGHRLDSQKVLTVRFSGSDQNYYAHVDYLSPVIDPKSGTILLRLVIENADQTIHSGQRAVIMLDSQTSTH